MTERYVIVIKKSNCNPLFHMEIFVGYLNKINVHHRHTVGLYYPGLLLLEWQTASPVTPGPKLMEVLDCLM